MKENYVVIMAGGIGSRFWPMSREDMPKQFLDILGTGKTLLQQTAERGKNICSNENILVVTSVKYKELVLEQLPFLRDSQILCEPMRRNTAPCIAYAMYKIAAKNLDANVVVTPADHLVLNPEEFTKTINLAINQAKSCDSLVTLGIKPSRPDTGYGYIQFSEESTNVGKKVRKVKTFTEKPTLEIAQEFLDSGDFYWNSGIFIWSVKSIIKSFKKHLNEVDELFRKGKNKYNTSSEEKFINEIYPICKNVSIDYGIMEKANNVFVVLSDFGWSDLGTWGSLYTHLEKDKNNNGIIGNKVFTYDTSNCIVNVPKEKLVVLQGLDNYIVVESNNTLLVCKKQDEQKIKQFVADIKISTKM